jgi:hypothetical protein
LDFQRRLVRVGRTEIAILAYFDDAVTADGQLTERGAAIAIRQVAVIAQIGRASCRERVWLKV